VAELEYAGPIFNVHAHVCAPDDVERLAKDRYLQAPTSRFGMQLMRAVFSRS
jgi:hypothetical protein